MHILFVYFFIKVYNLGLSVIKGVPKYNIIHFPHGTEMFENASIVAEIPARWKFNPSYMHTFSITENYFIIIEQPLSISLLEAVKAKYLKREQASVFKWFQQECTLFHVICRKSGEQKYTFKAAAFFYLHTINAYETKDHIIVDICCYRDPSVLDCMYIEAMKNMQSIKNYSKMFRSRPLRFVLPTKFAKIEQKQQTVRSNSLWNNLKTFACPSVGINKEEFLKKHQNTGNIIDSWKFEPKFWQDYERQYSIENLVEIPRSEARAYLMDDSNIFCVPERLCNMGCETPRLNQKQSMGIKYRFFYAISSDVDADVPGTVRFIQFFEIILFNA